MKIYVVKERDVDTWDERQQQFSLSKLEISMMLLHALKKVVAPIMHRMGFDVVRYPMVFPKTERLIERPFNVLEFIVSQLLSLDKQFFVEVGANNGIRWDSLHDLICKYHLTGLLVEPLPDIFEELKRNYAMESQLLFEGSALAKQEGIQSLFRVKSDAPIGDWARDKLVSISHMLSIISSASLESLSNILRKWRFPRFLSPNYSRSIQFQKLPYYKLTLRVMTLKF